MEVETEKSKDGEYDEGKHHEDAQEVIVVQVQGSTPTHQDREGHHE